MMIRLPNHICITRPHSVYTMMSIHIKVYNVNGINYSCPQLNFWKGTPNILIYIYIYHINHGKARFRFPILIYILWCGILWFEGHILLLCTLHHLMISIYEIVSKHRTYKIIILCNIWGRMCEEFKWHTKDKWYIHTARTTSHKARSTTAAYLRWACIYSKSEFHGNEFNPKSFIEGYMAETSLGVGNCRHVRIYTVDTLNSCVNKSNDMRYSTAWQLIP